MFALKMVLYTSTLQIFHQQQFYLTKSLSRVWHQSMGDFEQQFLL